MGEVIEFKHPRGLAQAAAERAALHDAGRRGDRAGVIEAAAPLIERARRQGFAVMQDGLPSEAASLAAALVTLSHSLAIVANELGTVGRHGAFGVYFSGRRLAWLDDGYGRGTALSVPVDVSVPELAAFIRARLLERQAAM